MRYYDNLKTMCLLCVTMTFAAVLQSCSNVEPEPDRFNIDATDIMLADYNAGTTDVLLATNCEPAVAFGADAAEWLSAEITRRCLTVSYKENTVEEERTGRIGITAGSIQLTVTVTQPGYVPSGPEPGPDPDDGIYELYDIYFENGVAMGVVFWTSEDKKSALVVSLDRTGALVPWSYDGTHVIGTGAGDGAANTSLLLASDEASSIPALEFCSSHGEGWYWPAMDEMVTLFETYNGTSYDAATKSEPANITEAEKEARARFDRLLTDNGGTALNTASETDRGDQYWTSTEQTFTDGVTYGSSFRFGKAYASGAGDMMVKTKATRYVRAVKAVPYTGEAGPGPEPVETKFPVYQENGKNAGIIYWTSEDGMTSKVLSLQRTDQIAWSYDGENTIGCSDKDDGAANMSVIEASPEADDIPAYAFCKSLGEGWYWPAINEMRVVFEAYNGRPYVEKGNVVPSAITDEEKEARAAFDLSLTTYGGTAMNLGDPSANGDRYWCSTEYYYAKDGKYYGSFMQFGKAYMSGPADQSSKIQSSGRYARCIKVITGR